MPDETVKVMVRCRPMNKKEKEKNCANCVIVDQKSNTINLFKPGEPDNQKIFTYDYVYPPEISQQLIYESSAFSLVESVVEGYNGTIFAYGQTGCGKTFTMLGDTSKDELKGIIPRSFQHIVNIISASTDKKFLVRCSYLEIYNEDIHDLLGADTKAKMELKESTDKGVFVKDLTMNIVKSVDEMNKWMDIGTKSRSTRETLMNGDSSRSHSIFTLYIECSVEDEKGEEKFTAGKLNLVDLAGSERQKKTGATGDSLKEATKINLSLSALGNVISALVDGKSTHIPYRDSKLTRLLQDSLGGNTKTIMIAAISPADYNYDESLSTLRYASRAKNIKNQPKINEDPKDALLREYAEEIKKLKELLQQQQLQQHIKPGEQIAPVTQGIVETPKINQQPVISKEEYEKQEQEKQELEKLKREKSIELKKLQDQNSELNKYREMMEEEMKKKEEAFINERLEKEKIEKLMKDVQQKLMVGGKGNDEENKKYNQIKMKMQKQEQEHEQLMQEKQKKEQQALQFEKQYNSLQEEVEEMRKFIKDLKKKYQQAMEEIKDLEKENEGDKGELLDSIRNLEKEVKMYQGIAKMMLNNDELESIKGACMWNEDKLEYKVPPFYFKDKKLKFPKLPNAQALDLVENEKEGRELEIVRDDDDDQQQQKYEQQRQQSTEKKLQSQNSINQKKNLYNNQNCEYFDEDMRMNGENFRYQNYEDPIMLEKAKLKQKYIKQQQKPEKQEKKNLPKVLEPMSEQQIDKMQEKLDKHSSAQAFINPVFYDKNKLLKQNQLKPIQSYKNLEQSSTANTDSLELYEEITSTNKKQKQAKLDKVNVDSVR